VKLNSQLPHYIIYSHQLHSSKKFFNRKCIFRGNFKRKLEKPLLALSLLVRGCCAVMFCFCLVLKYSFGRKSICQQNVIIDGGEHTYKEIQIDNNKSPIARDKGLRMLMYVKEGCKNTLTIFLLDHQVSSHGGWLSKKNKMLYVVLERVQPPNIPDAFFELLAFPRSNETFALLKRAIHFSIAFGNQN